MQRSIDKKTQSVKIEKMRTTDYEELNKQLYSLTDGVTSTVTNLANASALLFCTLPDVNWAGFYLKNGDALELGPFQGKPACVKIPFGKGVCGTAAEKEETQLVGDVSKFAGHIACDSASRSEIVLPVFRNGSLYGVLDIDSPILNRFTNEDKAGLESFAAILENSFRG